MKQLVGDVRLWIEDVKDSPMIREVVEIAERERLDEERRRGLAIVEAAKARGVDVPAGFADELTLCADADQMQGMIGDIVADDQALDGDLVAFVRGRGIQVPSCGA